MKEKRFGRIINMSSVVGLVAMPRRLAYNTAKSGLIGLRRLLAMDAARYGIKVNAIAPGYILTGALAARISTGLLDHDQLADRTPVGSWGRE